MAFLPGDQDSMSQGKLRSQPKYQNVEIVVFFLSSFFSFLFSHKIVKKKLVLCTKYVVTLEKLGPSSFKLKISSSKFVYLSFCNYTLSLLP